jgi:putative transposase
LRAYLSYKAATEGVTVVLVDEHHTSKTCPNPTCKHRHKPAGRVYRCPVCGFQAHRDVVGAANILSRQLFGELGKVRPPPLTMYRHPFLTGKRSGLDTGLPAMAVACDQQEAARL